MPFLHKKDIHPDKEYWSVTDNILFEPVYIKTRFGTYQSDDYSILSLAAFMNEKCFVVGHANYNSLGLSCQVPCTISYLMKESFYEKLNPEHGFKWTDIYFIQDDFFDLFNSHLEFKVVDCYIEHLFCDDQDWEGDLTKIADRNIKRLESFCEKNQMDFKKIERKIRSFFLH